MKKIIALLSVVILCLASICYAETDFSTMSKEEIAELIRKAQRELIKLTAEEQNNHPILFESDELSISVERIEFRDGKTELLNIYFRIINETDQSFQISIRQAEVNGWTVKNWWYVDVPAQSKTKADCVMIGHLDIDADVYNEADLQTVGLSLNIENDKEKTTLITPLVEMFYNADTQSLFCIE